MARKRYISTEISIDTKLNRVSDLAALLYSWMVPHAGDNCRLSAKNAEELRLSVIPGRRRSDEEIEAAVAELVDQQLIGREADGRYYFPAESFYKYQTYIKPGNRAETPPINAANQRKTPEIAEDQRKTAENAGDRRETPESTTSLSLPLSLSHSEETACAVSSARASLSLVVDNDDLGLGDKHPGNIAGWEVWNKFEFNCASKGKRLAFFTIEAMGVLLAKWRDGGSDPRAVVQKAVDAGWMTLHDLDPKDKKPPGDCDDGVVLARIEARANGG